MEHNTNETQASIFKAPLTKESMHEHVLTVSLLIARQLHFIFIRPESEAHEQAQAMLIGLESTAGMNDPDVIPGREDTPLKYEHLATTAFAITMEELYNFAYHGVVFGNSDELNSESDASWISRIIMDLSNSRFASEWQEYSPCLDSIKALLGICECAQARLILEAIQWDDSFMEWHANEGHGGLTFRQMAHLSGMSEASLRTLANPKRNNPLKTRSHGRHTYIDREDAKEWLISKGRYVPLTDTDLRGAHLDLSTEPIADLDELRDRLGSRLHFLLGSDDGAATSKALTAIRVGMYRKRLFDQTPYLELTDEDMNDEKRLRKLAKALQLSGELFVLKVKHLQAVFRAEELQREFEKAARNSQKAK
jgi:hypothetical protein